MLSVIFLPKTAPMLCVKFVPKKAPMLCVKFVPEKAPMLCVKFSPKKAPMSCVKFLPEKAPHVKHKIFTQKAPMLCVKFPPKKAPPHQLGPRYEGQLMSDGGAYSPFRSILLVRTHDYIITCVFGPTGGGGHEWRETRTLRCAPF